MSPVDTGMGPTAPSTTDQATGSIVTARRPAGPMAAKSIRAGGALGRYFIPVLLAAGALGGAAKPSPAWLADAEDTVTLACASRGLTLKRPVSVRPMTAFKGGYTPGIGRIIWEREFAQQWRAGWCALGAYCASAEASASNASKAPPWGLYESDSDTLFINKASTAITSTVAHETAHALQDHNFPALGSGRDTWQNRDLTAAINAAIEGDAHLLGWSFDPQRRLYLCSMHPAHATANHARWWNWKVNDLTAYEYFPHTFGPELALQRWLDADYAGIDQLLREPPLSTLAVLRPERAGPVAFIALPDALDEAVPGCGAGLRNTVGAMGIWGLLRQHADAGTDQLPEFLEHWLGDRFLHLACPGTDDDQLAWLTRWRTPAAASEFASRYQAIAASIPDYGGVLAAPPEAFVRGASVVVVTPALRAWIPRIAKSRVETFASFDAWIASGCFPLEKCFHASAGRPPAAPDKDYACSTAAPPPSGFTAWLARIRQARQRATRPATAPVLAGIGKLAAFCAVNGRRNSDFLNACRAVYAGVNYQVKLLADANWALLPHCATEAELRAWLTETDAPLTLASTLSGVYGHTLAIRTFAKGGVTGLRALLAEPPLSSLYLLRPELEGAVDVIALPRQALAARGCQITTSDVNGAATIGDLLIDNDWTPAKDNLPPFLLDWRGDRQAHVRCADGEGWLWVSRWRSREAALTFTRHYAELWPATLTEAPLPTITSRGNRHSVWMIAPALAPIARLLRDETEVRGFASFQEWVDGGCFPEPACN